MNEYQRERLNYIKEYSKNKDTIIEFGYGEILFPEILKLNKKIIIIENDPIKIDLFYKQHPYVIDTQIINGDFYKIILDILEDNTLINCMTFNDIDNYKSSILKNEILKLLKFNNVTFITFDRKKNQKVNIKNFNKNIQWFFLKNICNPEIHKKYFDVEFLRNADFKFNLDDSENICSLSLYDKNINLHVCGTADFRDDMFLEIYISLKKYNINNIIELGVGLNKFYNDLKSIDIHYKIIEINTKLYEYYKDIIDDNIINDDFYNFISNNHFSNTAFIVRQPISEFKNLFEYINYLKRFKNHFNKNNILVIEKGMNNFKIPNCIETVFHKNSVETYTYFIKL